VALSYTGERFVPGIEGIIEAEHMHRYLLACELASGLNVLDVASGEGYGSNLLARTAAAVIGVDISSNAINHAQETYRQPNLNFRVGDCCELPVDTASIDMVVSFETIEHHDKHEAMIFEIARVLKPDGFLLISSPNKLTYSDIPGKHNRFHVKELYLEEFETLLRRYFPNVVLYGQRVEMFSIITSLQAVQAPFEHFRWSGDQVVSSKSIDSSVYFVALASKSVALPQLPISAFEIDRPAALTSDIAPRLFETKMYWRSARTEPYDKYSEERACSQHYAVDSARHVIELTFPEAAGLVSRIRLDVIEGLGVVDIHDLRLLDPSGIAIWKWSGDQTLMQQWVRLVFLTGLTPGASCSIISIANDPWCELDLPDAIYARIQPGCTLRIELTPYWLLDRLPFVLKQIAQRVTSSPHTSSLLTVPSSTDKRESPSLAVSLEAVKGLLQATLTKREQTIAQQNWQLRSMREELIRAEAQLDLLKDVMLDSREEDRL
jgi:ubiquinone/menaquinone biosynthesis C-methylase UbiE